MGTEHIQTDVCVVGAGPAGITSALELAAAGLKVLLVESGDHHFLKEAQALSDALLDCPQTHAVMDDAVRRCFGGTTHLWGGRCVPYDPVDFMPRSFVQDAEWPITYEEIASYYKQACIYTSCGDPTFTVAAALDPVSATRPFSEKFVNGVVTADYIERWSAEPNFGVKYRSLVENHPNIHLAVSSTCVGIHTCQEKRVSYITLVRRNGSHVQRVKVEAAFYVLACGGLETTRLLLISSKQPDGLAIPPESPLGKYYMGHISGKIASIRLNGAPEKTIYHFEKSGNTYIRRRITFLKEFLLEKKLRNIAFWLDNPPAAEPNHESGILSAAYLALCTPILRDRLAPAAIRKALIGQAEPKVWPHVWNLVKDTPTVVPFVLSFIYKRYFAKPRLPGFFVGNHGNVYALHYHGEQAPNVESTVELADDTDVMGMRRLRINLKYSPSDADSVIAAHQELDNYLRQHDIGELVYWYPQERLQQAVLEQAKDGFHQIGTTRMGNSPDKGVTDGWGRVYGVDNLFIASSSVFPSSGQANPTLTIVAFAIRQAKFIAALAGKHAVRQV